MILYRSYVEGILTHAEMSWQSEQTLGNGPSKDLVDSYLTTNGLPIHQDGNTVFKGDKVFKDEMRKLMWVLKAGARVRLVR